MANDAPVIFKSKIQQSVALSTAEAERPFTLHAGSYMAQSFTIRVEGKHWSIRNYFLMTIKVRLL